MPTQGKKSGQQSWKAVKRASGAGLGAFLSEAHGQITANRAVQAKPQYGLLCSLPHIAAVSVTALPHT